METTAVEVKKEYKPEYKESEVHVNGEPLTELQVCQLGFALTEYIRHCREKIMSGSDPESFAIEMVDAFKLLECIHEENYNELHSDFLREGRR